MFQGAEPGGGPDRQLVLLYDVDPAQNLQNQRSPIAYILGERVNSGAWQQKVFTFDVTRYRGQRLWLYASVSNDGQGGRAWMLLDDVDVSVCP